MARANKDFDERVRNYVIQHVINRYSSIDELQTDPKKRKGALTCVHEIFPGSNRKRCFYVENCMFFVSGESHDTAQGDEEQSVQLLQNRLRISEPHARLYFMKLQYVVNRLDIKKHRAEWAEFFENGCTGTIPLIKVEL